MIDADRISFRDSEDLWGMDTWTADERLKAEIDSIPEENAKQIHDMAYREAKEFLAANGVTVRLN